MSPRGIEGRRVVQLVPALHRGDAIGDEVLALDRAFRAWGAEPRIATPSPDPDLRHRAVDPEAACGDPQALLLLHFALPSPLTALFGTAPAAARVLIHHNLTPARFFAGENAELFRIARLGEEHLASLRGACELAFGDSAFNAEQLRRLGYERVEVLPILLDLDRYRQRPSLGLARVLRRQGGPRVLFVGRMAPNKAIEDVLRVFSIFQRRHAPGAHLDLAGKVASPAYARWLRRLAGSLACRNVHMYGHVPHRDLLALYRAADVFLGMSRHEGFCVPLLESMIMEVPIVVRAAAAVPWTLGGAGLALPEETPAEVAAEAVHWVVSRPELARDLVERGRRRARHLAPERHLPRLARHLDEVLTRGGSP